jgi:hypothetical protein
MAIQHRCIITILIAFMSLAVVPDLALCQSSKPGSEVSEDKKQPLSSEPKKQDVAATDPCDLVKKGDIIFDETLPHKDAKKGSTEESVGKKVQCGGFFRHGRT